MEANDSRWLKFWDLKLDPVVGDCEAYFSDQETRHEGTFLTREIVPRCEACFSCHKKFER